MNALEVWVAMVGPGRAERRGQGPAGARRARGRARGESRERLLAAGWQGAAAAHPTACASASQRETEILGGIITSRGIKVE